MGEVGSSSGLAGSFHSIGDQQNFTLPINALEVGSSEPENNLGTLGLPLPEVGK